MDSELRTPLPLLSSLWTPPPIEYLLLFLATLVVFPRNYGLYTFKDFFKTTFFGCIVAPITNCKGPWASACRAIGKYMFSFFHTRFVSKVYGFSSTFFFFKTSQNTCLPRETRNLLFVTKQRTRCSRNST